MNPRTPLGFYVAALCAAGFGVLMGGTVVALDGAAAGGAVGMVLGRAAAALLAALSAVAAEALWNARPWAWRASLVLALAYAAAVTLFCAVGGGVAGGVAAFMILVPSGGVLIPLLMYIRDRCAAMFGPALIPRSITPVPAPAGRRPPPWW